MFDNGPVPGRNDVCWCGSGKKYKKCHSAFDERLERLWEEGWEVLPRTLYKKMCIRDRYWACPRRRLVGAPWTC